MATYYCDLGEDYTDQDGSDNGANSYSGVGGLQAAIRGTGNATALAQTANPNQDILYVKGTGDLSRLVWLDIDQQVSGGGLAWALGDEVQNDNDGGGTEGDDWTGVICELDYDAANDQILVELDSGKDEDDINLADGIDNVTQGNQGDLDGKDTRGWEIDENEGSPAAGLPIYVIGVNDSWANDGTKAVLNGNSLTNDNVVIDDKNGFIVENIASHTSAGCGFAWTNTAHPLDWMFVNCDSYSNLGDGWGRVGGSTKSLYRGFFVRCRAWSNSACGWGQSQPYSTFVFCTAHTNGSHGFSSHIAATYYACLSYENTSYGFQGYQGSACLQCVTDGGSAGHVTVYGHSLAVGCRFTNASGWSEIAASSAFILDLWNYIGSGTAGGDYLIDQNFEGTATRLASGSDGYEDAANDKYNLRLGGAGFRTEVDMLGSNYVRFNRGLPNVMIPRVRED